MTSSRRATIPISRIYDHMEQYKCQTFGQALRTYNVSLRNLHTYAFTHILFSQHSEASEYRFDKGQGYLGCDTRWITCNLLSCIDDRNLKLAETFDEQISIPLILGDEWLQKSTSETTAETYTTDKTKLFIQQQSVYLPYVFRNMIFHVLGMLLVCYIYLHDHSNLGIFLKKWCLRPALLRPIELKFDNNYPA